MFKNVLFLILICTAASSFSGEEKIRGIIEKSAKAGAAAQITDALSEIYYISKTDEAEKLIAPFIGQNKKVVITGTVETKEGDPAYYFNLKTVEAYAAKLPPAIAAAPAAPAPADAPKPVETPPAK